MNIYELLKDNASKFDLLTFPEGNITFDFHLKGINKTKEFDTYFSSEFKKIASDQTKIYVTKNDEDVDINLYIMSQDYLVRLKAVNTFQIFNKNLDYIGAYSLDTYSNKSHKIQPESCSISLFNSEKINYSCHMNESSFKIRTNEDLSIIKTSRDSEDNVIQLQGTGNNQITSVQYNEENIIVKFKGSFYQKLILDYEFNILEIDFHSKIKSKLNIGTPLLNIKSYEDLMKSSSEHFEFYSLINDSNFPIKLKEHDFQKHLSIIKEITSNKNDIFELLSLSEEFNIKPQFTMQNGAYSTGSEREELEKLCEKYLNHTYTKIIVESQKTHSFKYYMKDIIMFLLTIKENNIFPIDIPVIKKIDEISSKINSWHNNLNQLKKSNKAFKAELKIKKTKND